MQSLARWAQSSECALACNIIRMRQAKAALLLGHEVALNPAATIERERAKAEIQRCEAFLSVIAEFIQVSTEKAVMVGDAIYPRIT